MIRRPYHPEFGREIETTRLEWRWKLPMGLTTRVETIECTSSFKAIISSEVTRDADLEHCRRWWRQGTVTVVTCAELPKRAVFDGYRNAWRKEEIVDGITVVRVWTYLAANKGFCRGSSTT
jgi:hypothetical protein